MINLREKVTTIEFGKNIAHRVPNFSGYVVLINSGLIIGLWILFIQNKTPFAVTVTAFLSFTFLN